MWHTPKTHTTANQPSHSYQNIPLGNRHINPLFSLYLWFYVWLFQEHLKVTVKDGNILCISVEYKAESASTVRRVIFNERWYGQYSRSLRLPSTIDVGGITALLDNGVLRICLPKQERANTQHIRIQGPH